MACNEKILICAEINDTVRFYVGVLIAHLKDRQNSFHEVYLVQRDAIQALSEDFEEETDEKIDENVFEYLNEHMRLHPAKFFEKEEKE